MVKVSIEVREGAARSGVSVQAESIGRALRLVAGRYPAGEVRLKFPINPEGYFVDDSAARVGIREQTDVKAA